jgi:hypothetical protein
MKLYHVEMNISTVMISFSILQNKKSRLFPVGTGLQKATGRTYLCSALAGTITWRVILDKSSKAVEKKKFFN